MGIMAMADEKSPDTNEIQAHSLSIGPESNKNLPINEALQMQIEVHRRLQEQPELRIEAQGKYLQAVLEKAQETLGNQNLGTDGLQAAQVQLSGLASKVSAEYPNENFLEPKDFQSLHAQQMQRTYPPNCSLNGSMTSQKGTQTSTKMFMNRLGLRPYLGGSTSAHEDVTEEPLFQRMEFTSPEGCRENRPYLSIMVNNAEATISSSEVGLHGQRGNGDTGYTEERIKKDEDCKFETQNQKGNSATELDLNTNDENHDKARPKHFGLNGFSWN
ncbi:PREDICTED: myb-related protein 2-like [Tarenaya hassleriana]|uniref:myb-related protein 2-like n=1 Tax=Tarenaya hassleriana TaxID=28532 RepID=UPI0008FD23B4|nr:PREDICTED: myb-related protein 2-like [Tarenaya hassleriana]